MRHSCLLAFLLVLGGASLAWTHGGEDHGAEPQRSATSSTGVIHMPKERQFALGVRTVRISEREVRPAIQVLGKVEAPPWGRAQITAPQTARVTATPDHVIPSFGQVVKKGQILLYLEAVAAGTERVALLSERLRLEAEVQRFRGALALARAEHERLASLEDVVARKELQRAEIEWKSTEAELRQAEASLQLHRAALGEGDTAEERLALRSPIDGVVAFAHAAYGEQVEQGKVLLEVVDPAALWVEAQVYEADLSKLDGSVEARVVLDAFPAQTWPADLAAVGSIVDETTRTTSAVVKLRDVPPGKLKVGLFARVYLLAGSQERGLAVPKRAIVQEEGGAVVLGKESAETFARIKVELGETDGEWTIVRSGLQEGDLVVTAGVADVRAAALATPSVSPAASR